MLSKIRTYIRTLDHEPLATDVLEYALENLDMHDQFEEDDEPMILEEIQTLIKEEEFAFPLAFNVRDKAILNRALDAYINQMKVARRESNSSGLRKAFTKDIRELRDLQEKVGQVL